MRASLVAVLLLCGAAWRADAPRAQRAPVPTSRAPCTSGTAMDASIISLIATPGRFDHKCVRVIGYLHLEFEGRGLYLTRADYEHAVSKNALWVGEAADTGGSAGRLNDTYVLLEGEFQANEHGHMGAFSGAILRFTRLERWPASAEWDSMSRSVDTVP